MSRSFFLFAGEASGDVHGEKIVRSLRQEFPKCRIYGVGGPKMRSAGFESILPMENFQVMGFVDVFFALPRLMKHFFWLKKQILEKSPDLVLLIDYPGFNLALAKALRKKGFQGKICQYICPSVWAWGKKRIAKMEENLDALFTIFPFESELFDAKKLHVRYVGHPLSRQAAQNKALPIDIDLAHRVVAVFPGSRRKEIERNFPLQLRAAKELLKNHHDLFFVVSVAQPLFSRRLDELMRQEKMERERFLFIDAKQNQSLLKRANFALAKSGTNNLELALHQIPTVVTYGIGKLDLFIAKNLLKINLPHYCIVNIIAGERVFPELIGPNLTEESLSDHASRLLSSENIYRECRDKCGKIGKIFEGKEPEREIAEGIKVLLLTGAEKG